jgi:hypothetical protein
MCSGYRREYVVFEKYRPEHRGQLVFLHESGAEEVWTLWNTVPDRDPHVSIFKQRAYCTLPYIPCFEGHWIMGNNTEEHQELITDTMESREYTYVQQTEKQQALECCRMTRPKQQTCMYDNSQSKMPSDTHYFAIPVMLKYTKNLSPQIEWVECGYVSNAQYYAHRVAVNRPKPLAVAKKLKQINSRADKCQIGRCLVVIGTLVALMAIWVC